MLGDTDPTNPDDGRDPNAGQEPPAYPGAPPSGIPPPPAAPPSLTYGGKATQALIDAVYSHDYVLKNGQIVFTGQGEPFWKQYGQANAAYLNSLADPLAAKDYKKFFQTLYGGSNATQYNLTNTALSGVLKAAGFNVTPANQAGQISKIQKPGFTGKQGWVRVITGDPIKGGSWDWVDQPDDPETPPTPFGGNGNGIDPSYLSPWDKAFNFEGFQAPNDEELHADPGFKFRRDNAVGAYQNSSAARGLLNSSNAPYDIATLADSLAGQEFSNIWNRKFSTWRTSHDNAWDKYQNEQDTFFKNQNSPFDKIFKAGTLGLDAASR